MSASGAMSSRCGRALKRGSLSTALKAGRWPVRAQSKLCAAMNLSKRAIAARCRGVRLRPGTTSVAADDMRRRLAPQPRIGKNGVALVERPSRRFRFLVERSDHPRARRIDAALAVDEGGDRGGRVHVLSADFFRVDPAEIVRDLHAHRRVQRTWLRVGEQHRPRRHHVGVEVARRERRVADVALDEVGLAGALLELPRLCEQFVRVFGRTGLPPRISPALANSAVLTWNRPPCVSQAGRRRDRTSSRLRARRR